MTRTCKACGETFETLSALRMHDCPDEEDDAASAWEKERDEHMARIRKLEREENLAARRAASAELTDALERAGAANLGAVHEALAYYERHLAEEWESRRRGEDDHYEGFRRVFGEQAGTALEEATQANGWPFLLDVLEAYWPTATFDLETYADVPDGAYPERSDVEEYPYIGHVLTTVTGQQLVRTRLEDGVEAIPERALEFQLAFHRSPDDTGAWIESMSYGWGIGHPDHPVEASLQALVDGEYDIWFGGAVEHAVHADQRAAVTLLEEVFAAGVVSDPATALRGIGAVERSRYPESGDHWDWEAVYPDLGEAGLEWDPDVREQLRELVVEVGLEAELPQEWTLGDLVL
ncbi:hypothetical protein [Natrialbaceae archaeon AArc-T1-2]|uniref:hypothetical protein n=1 Tax=Natrialbaceae archaeon AArc-T1-2 TaxID=3053904 RepID=UPI00255ACFB6|nr:hypothetical protein [Natrialbaceae archaeon AArc-T1-2]WIV68843.1 hypothetical protein QQ977_16205 [Natrialbaceae archaeon AArc-T1-2]